MKLKGIYLNIPILVIGLLYLIITNLYNSYIFSFEYLAISITTVIIIFLIIIGLLILIGYSRKSRNDRILTQSLYWFIISSLILTNFIVIFYPVFLRIEEDWILFVEFVTILIGLPSILLISTINPIIDTNNQNNKPNIKTRRLLRFLIPTVIILLFFSAILVWALLYVRSYGSDEGMSAFILYYVMRYNIISFISFCGIINLQREKPLFEKLKFSISNNKVLSLITIVSIIGWFSTLGPIILIYLRETSRKIITINILFYYVFIIGTISALTLLYYIKKHIAYLKENDLFKTDMKR